MLYVDVEKRLAEFSLTVRHAFPPGITAVFGPSGSGKSTLLHLIAGLLLPDRGTIRLGERVFVGEGTKPLPPEMRRVGYVLQAGFLFPHMTVWQNIAYGIRRRIRPDDPEIRPLLEVTRLSPLLGRKPHTLSGGERQRVALVRALATQPDVLLLDEPFANLDQTLKEDLYATLLELVAMRPIPVLLVTHDPEERDRLAEDVLFLERGRARRDPHWKSGRDPLWKQNASADARRSYAASRAPSPSPSPFSLYSP
ncbi:MAG: ATP-binding cassette domain-containing protein [Brockia lithotrophica]|nr:ATP-binding cassette domain-containing protein [Brockia lithotrophica]